MESKVTITVGLPDPEFSRTMRLYRRNMEWMSDHGRPLYQQHRGKYVAVSEGEVFVSDDAWEAERLAQEKHPDDVPFVIYIPKARYERIYAYRGPLARVR
jgi:hypothetical protein